MKNYLKIILKYLKINLDVQNDVALVNKGKSYFLLLLNGLIIAKFYDKSKRCTQKLDLWT